MEQKLELFQKWQSERRYFQDKTFDDNDFVKNKKLQNYFEELTVKAIEQCDVDLLSVLLNPFLHPELLKYDQLCAMHDYYWMAHEIIQIELDLSKRLFDILGNYYTKKMRGSPQDVVAVKRSLNEAFEEQKERSHKTLREAINNMSRRHLIPFFWIDGLKYILPLQGEAGFYHCVKHLQSELGEYKILAERWQPMPYKNEDEDYKYLQEGVERLPDKVKKLKESMDQASAYKNEFQKSTIPLPVILKNSSIAAIDEKESIDNEVKDMMERDIRAEFLPKKKSVESICYERKEIIENYIPDSVDSSNNKCDEIPSKRVASDHENNAYDENGVRGIQFYRGFIEILKEIGNFEINATNLRAAVLTARIDPNLCLDSLRDTSPEIKNKTYRGDTLLHFTVRQCYSQEKTSEQAEFSKDIIDQLTRFGANGFKKNSQGMSPIRLVFKNQDKKLFDRLVEVIDRQPFQHLITSKAQSILFKDRELMEFVKKELHPFKDKLKDYAKRIRDASEFPKNTECFIRMNESLYEIIDVFSTKLLSYNIAQIQTDIDAPLFGKNQLWGIAKEFKKRLSLLEQQDYELRAAFANATRQDYEEVIEKTCLQGKLSTEIKNDLPNTTASCHSLTTTSSSFTTTTRVVQERGGEIGESIEYMNLKISYERLFKETRENDLKRKEEDDLKRKEMEERFNKIESKLASKVDQEEMSELRNTVNQQIFVGQETRLPLQIQQKKSTYTSLMSRNDMEEVMSGEKSVSCSLL